MGREKYDSGHPGSQTHNARKGGARKDWVVLCTTAVSGVHVLREPRGLTNAEGTGASGPRSFQKHTHTVLPR